MLSQLNVSNFQYRSRPNSGSEEMNSSALQDRSQGSNGITNGNNSDENVNMKQSSKDGQPQQDEGRANALNKDAQGIAQNQNDNPNNIGPALHQKLY